MQREFVITHKVDSHHTNPEYRCLLVNLLGRPEVHYTIVVRDAQGRVLKNVFPELVKLDWMPTIDHLMRVNQYMWDWKPTEFADTLRVAVQMDDFERGEWR